MCTSIESVYSEYKAEFILERKAFFHRFLACAVLFSIMKPRMRESNEKTLCVRV